MRIALKVLTSLAGAFIILSGLLFVFKPSLAMEHAQLGANDTFGIGTIRGLIGGSMLAAGITAIWSMIKNTPLLLVTPLLICIGWTLGRIVSLFADGFNSGTISGILQSGIMAIIFAIALKVLTQKAKE